MKVRLRSPRVAAVGPLLAEALCSGVLLARVLLARVLLAGVLVAGILVAAGCGGIISPDLFVVQRSGSTPGAHLTLLVSEEGIAHCNGGPPHRISDSQLIKARTIQEKLHDYAAKHESLSAAPGSVLSYYVRDVDGSVRFSDNSLHQPHVMREMALLVLTLAREACRLPQTGA